jgi:hypothetical protein
VPTTTATPTVIGPDRYGRIRVHTDRFTITLSRDLSYQNDYRLKTRVFPDYTLACSTSEDLAELDRLERDLGDDRNLDVGIDPLVDHLYQELRAVTEVVYVDLATEALRVLAGMNLIEGNIERAIDRAKFSAHACGDGLGCRCTPGVETGAFLYMNHMEVRIDVGPPAKPEPIPTEDIPADLLRELAQHAIDEDGLDITIGDALDGHHRAAVHLEIARRAYLAGFHAGRRAP